jgi:hypothetical protein
MRSTAFCVAVVAFTAFIAPAAAYDESVDVFFLAP